MGLLSVVVPCYNEAAVLPVLHDRLARVLDGLPGEAEVVLVDDGSGDATWAGMTALAARDPRLVCVRLSRNFGHQPALLAGLRAARGDAVLVLDADLQDPPELLPAMLARMAADGADVVYGVRTARHGDPAYKRAAAHLFYRLLGRLSRVPVPADAGDFRLLSRRVVDRLLDLPEHPRYVRGAVAWLGFKQVPLAYERQPRAAGHTHYPLRRLVGLAVDATTGFSDAPLAAPLWAAAALAAAALAAAAAAGWWAVTAGAWPTAGLLLAVVLGLAAGQLAALGVVGVYLGRVLAEVRGRPQYVIDQVVGRSAQVRAARGAA